MSKLPAALICPPAPCPPLAPLPRGRISQMLNRSVYQTSKIGAGLENFALVYPGPCLVTFIDVAITGASEDLRVLLFDAPNIDVADPPNNNWPTYPFGPIPCGPTSAGAGEGGLVVMPEELFRIGDEDVPGLPFDTGCVIAVSTELTRSNPADLVARFTVRLRS